MKKLPVGLQSFRDIREEDWLYVDKTESVFRVIETGKFCFFARPRRFGKSLAVSTMYELFRGNRKLFEGLWIEPHWDWSRAAPVIWLRFAVMAEPTGDLLTDLNHQLQEIATGYGIELSSDNPGRRFAGLIKQLHAQHGKVVVLVDEYDKPLVDHLDRPERLEANRELLRAFYGVLKDSDPYLRFVFITGVSAFSKVSLFSAMNNLQSITLDPVTETLAGFTETEIDTYLTPYLGNLDREVLRYWYNGYSWTGKVRVYNPFSLLSALNSGSIRNFWFATGTPYFLIKLMRKHRMVNLKLGEIVRDQLTSFEPTHIDPVGLLFQTGYLTIVRPDELSPQFYYLDYPNQEVRQSLQAHLLNSFGENEPIDTRGRALRMAKALLSNDLARFFEQLDALFAAVPYDLWNRDGEFTYHAVLYLTFELLGIPIQSEVHTKHGRADAVVELPEVVYAFEFKWNDSVAAALRQIEANGYLDPYRGGDRRLVAVGVQFGGEERRVLDWEAVER